MDVKCDVSEVKVDRFNWFTGHPKFQEMLLWGFDDTEQLQTTLLVYLDLCEAKNWWKTELHPCWSLRMGYVTGKPTKKGDYVTVLPIQTKTVLSPSSLQMFLASVEPRHSKHESSEEVTATPTPTPAALIPAEHQAKRSLTLAITDPDSSIVYYRISNGLVSPDSAPRMSMEEEEEVGDQGRGKGKGRGRGKGKKGGKRKGGPGGGKLGQAGADVT